MKIGIFTNRYKDKDMSVTRQILDLLTKNGIEPIVYDDIIGDFSSAKNCGGENKPVDYMLTVGGDGTILRIANYCAYYNIPILGINLGNVGFLTEIEPCDILQIVDILKNNKFVLEKRSLIKAEFGGKIYCGLNEVVVSRTNFSKMLTLKVFIENQLVDVFCCDGYIVSTPTGSTAYSLSAGGPVLSPNTRAFALTPINAHSLHNRPIVVGDNETIRIEFNGSTENATVIVDGNIVGAVAGDGCIDVSLDEKLVCFIRLIGSNFYAKLLKKLNTWGSHIGEEVR